MHENKFPYILLLIKGQYTLLRAEQFQGFQVEHKRDVPFCAAKKPTPKIVAILGVYGANVRLRLTPSVATLPTLSVFPLPTEVGGKKATVGFPPTKVGMKKGMSKDIPFFMEPTVGIEPTTCSLRMSYSTIESRWHA